MRRAVAIGFLSLALVVPACVQPAVGAIDAGRADVKFDANPPDLRSPPDRSPGDQPGSGGPDHSIGPTWKTLVSGTSAEFHGVWGSSFSNVYMVGAESTLGGVIFEGSAASGWTKVFNACPYFYGLSGSGSFNQYAVGTGGAIYYSSGSSCWTSQASGTSNPLYAVWIGTSDVYGVGLKGTIVHSTLLGGGSWTVVSPSPTTEALSGIWGVPDGTDVYAVGTNGVILRSISPGAWNSEVSGSTASLNAVWGSGSGDVYVVGSSGTIIHLSSTSWTTEASGTSSTLHAIWGSGTGDVYAAGDGGIILHSIGTGSWTPESSGTTSGLFGIWGSSASDVYIVGSGGVILHGP